MRFEGKCPSGKQWSYPSLADAMGDLVRVQQAMRERDPDGKVPERAHPCSLCKFWHLTSSEREQHTPPARRGKLWRRR